jgi:hypothetical protein
MFGAFAAVVVMAQNPQPTTNNKASTVVGKHVFNPAAAQVIPGETATIAPQPVEPKVILKGPDQHPIYVNNPLTFTMSLEPPPSPRMRVSYQFRWDDDASGGFSEQATATHRFSVAGLHTVDGTTVINGDFKVGSNRVTVEVGGPAPPQPPSTGTGTPVTSTKPDPEVVIPRPVPRPVKPPRGGIDVGGPNIPTWVIVLAAGAAILILIRAVIPRSPERPEPAAAPPISFHGGLRPTDHTIEHPEKILNGLTVRLRTGIRSAVPVKGEPDA